MTEEQILSRLAQRVDKFDQFAEEINYLYKHKPYSMIHNENIKRYLRSCKWFQDGTQLYNDHLERRWNTRTRSGQLMLGHYKCSDLISNLSLAIDRDEFWLGLISCHPDLILYYKGKSEVVKSAARIMR